jgi:hypothetical protein
VHPDDDRGAGHARRLVAGTLYNAKTLLAQFPSIAIPMQRVRGRGEVIGSDTDIVIEGFPRSASTFAVAAFRLAQEPRTMVIAHHTHMPAQVLEAVRRRIPALVLIRGCEDAVISYLIRNPDQPVRPALRGYLRFYEPLLRVRGGFVVGPFEQVIADFGAVIRRVNERFGTRFAPFAHSEPNLARIDREIDVYHRSRWAHGAPLERVIPRPSAHRAALKDEVRRRYLAEAPPEWVERAEVVYRTLTS